MHAWALGCFHSQRALLEGGDKECPFSGVTKSGRVWRNVPESDARSVDLCLCEVTWGGDSSVVRAADL